MNTTWVVELTFATDTPLPPAVLEQLDTEGDPRQWYVAPRVGGPGVRVSVYADGQDPAATTAEVLSQVQDWLGEYDITARLHRLSTMTEAESEEAAFKPDVPELLSASDVADELGISRQRVHQLHADNSHFPPPYARLGTGPIWTLPVIEHFAKVWTRKPGRPAKAS
jgi:hypothetical protein